MQSLVLILSMTLVSKHPAIIRRFHFLICNFIWCMTVESYLHCFSIQDLCSYISFLETQNFAVFFSGILQLLVKCYVDTILYFRFIICWCQGDLLDGLPYSLYTYTFWVHLSKLYFFVLMNDMMCISDLTSLCGHSTLRRPGGWSHYSDTWCEGPLQSWWEKAGHRWENLHPHLHWTQLGTHGSCCFCLPSHVWSVVREGNTSVQFSLPIYILVLSWSVIMSFLYWW